jgi:hypothetical protein
MYALSRAAENRIAHFTDLTGELYNYMDEDDGVPGLGLASHRDVQ